MYVERLDKLIQEISLLNQSDYTFLEFAADILIPIVTTIIAAVFAYYVAKYQVDKSDEQQRIQREKELNDQRKFMVDELKIEKAQSFINNKVLFSTNIMNMINYSRAITYESSQEKSITEKDAPNPKILELNKLVYENSEAMESHSVTLETTIILYDLDVKVQEKYKEFRNKTQDFHNACVHTDTFDEYKASELGQECINLSHYFDDIIRKELRKLLDEMKMD